MELLSQDLDNIDRPVTRLAELQTEIVNSEQRRDPLFKIPMADWYEMKAKFLTGKYRPSVWQIHRRKANRRWHVVEQKPFWPQTELYSLYDSYSAPHKGGKKADGIKRQHEKRGRLSLLLWFLRRHGLRLSPAVIVPPFFIWFFFLGGLSQGIVKFQDMMQDMVKAKKVQAETKPMPPPPQHAHAPADGIPRSQPAPTPEPEPEAKEDPIVFKTDFDGEGEKTWTVEDLAQLLQEQQQLRATIEAQQEQQRITEQIALEAQEQAMQLLQDASALMCMTPNTVTFTNGFTVAPGEQPEGTVYDDRTVESINYPSRSIRFDDGTVLRLQGVRNVAATDALKAAVSGDTAGAQDRAAELADEARSTAKDIYRSEPDAARGISPVTEPAGGGIHHLGGTTRFEAGQPGSTGPDS